MESIDLKRLNITIEESRDIINFIAQKRGISTEKLLSTIKPNLKHKNNEILTTKAHQKQQKYIKKQKKYIKKQKEYIKKQKKNTSRSKKNTSSSKNTTKIT